MNDINKAVAEMGARSINKPEATVTISISEYADYIRKEERYEMVREYVQNDKYAERETIAKIMGFELPGEEKDGNGKKDYSL